VPRHGVFPGSFDPLTVAHLAIADAARAQCGLDLLDLVVSHVALAKEDRHQAPVDARLAAIDAATTDRPWLRARDTEHQLLADIASGYDLLVVGADKWLQLHDTRFYDGSAAAMHAALARLPPVAVAPRAGVARPDGDVATVLDMDPAHLHVSSTAVRSGRHEWRAGAEPTGEATRRHGALRRRSRQTESPEDVTRPPELPR
jgi:nicotinic acid mononucleotide adenylyltransferase